MDIRDCRSELDKLKGRKEALLEDIGRKKKENKKLIKKINASKEAQAFIQKVAKDTQDQLSFQLSSIVSVAMQAVFEDPYQIELEFIERRNRVELDIYFVRNGNKIDPKKASGGGAVDLAAMALRLSCWAIRNRRTRNTILMDEPLKWLKGDGLPEKGSKILKEISKKLDLQIIMVSHSKELINAADKVFHGSIKNGISVFEPETIDV